MNKKVEVVVRGFLALTDAERSELITQINKYLNGTSEVKQSIRKSISESLTVNFGPAPGGCPCCGR
jgi:F0F1-type ATP synthase delta subunit